MFSIYFCIILQSILYIAETAKPYHAVPTYFRRLHKNGSLVDAKNPMNQIDFSSIAIPSYLDSDIKLKVSPFIVENGGFVNVSWSGIRYPTSSDFIAFFCPSDAESKRYLDDFRVTNSPTWQKGYGQENSLQVWNMRSKCEFRYYNKSTLLARSNPVMFHGGAAMPLQGHLALANANTEMRVMWVSGTGK